ncbi:alpha/beta hydrolase [Gilvimarinus chinensis]|uniref:alpha/beta hydrolase n=1 Tax=Gilvimarinus chinensis TaxID=396005 RepID=UPI0003662D3D|nr:alpha/beta hydrolase-fold protein [Gilvimarinus chinensis]
MSIQQIEASNADGYLPAGLKYITVHSSALKGRGNISCYNTASRRKDLPIVVLLHGVYGNHWVWTNLGGAHTVYDSLRQNNAIDEMLLVMPEDGSYYAGSGYLPLKEGRNFEAWIMQDVLEAVIRTVDCVSENSPVFLSGLSMGGYGALRLGAKYASQVKGISAHSSITKLEDFKHFIKEDLSIYQCENPQETNLMYWISKNQADFPPLRLDCGTEDLLYSSNIEFMQKLDEQKVKYLSETPAGGHEWSYWNRQVAATFRFFHHLQQKS